MPSYIGQSVNNYSNVTSQTVNYSPAANDLVLMFLEIDGPGATVAVFDNAGVDIFGNQLNAWVLVDSGSVGNIRLELWACVKVITPFTSVTVDFSTQNGSVNIGLLEYSPCAIDGYGNANNTGYSNLYFTGSASNESSILVVYFGAQDQQPLPGIGTPQQTIPASITRATGFGVANNYGLILEQDTIVSEKLQSEAIFDTPSTGILAVGVVLSGGISLSSPPGFSPVDENLLETGDIIHAFTLDQISQNANFGMVRPEFFYTVQVDGDDVPLPVSPADGYNYVRDELIYLYVPLMTFDPATNWSSGAGILFFTLWDVDPITGKVTSNEYYHPDGNVPINKTSDGQLVVLTVAQRGYGGLAITEPPALLEIPFSLIGGDKPLKQELIQTLAKNSKFAAIKAEVIFMGEFTNGQQVPQPVSPEDGYLYPYAEVKFISSWRWTAAPNAFGPPPTGTAGGWSQMNEMTASVSANGLVACNVTFYNHGLVDPSTPTFGGQAYGRLAVFAFCERTKGPYFGVPPMTLYNGLAATTNSIFIKLDIEGLITGNMSIDLTSGTGGPLNVAALVIKKCNAGSLTVLTTDAFLFSGSGSGTVPAASTLTTDNLNYTLQEGFDYYLVLVYTGNFALCVAAGLVNSATPKISPANGGDHSGDTTIPALTYNVSEWLAVSAIRVSIIDGTLADNFSQLPLTAFLPGQVFPYTQVQQLANNVQESAYAIEYFGPTTHVNGDTVALPVSPIDGYTYSRAELFYIWQVRDSGTGNIRLFGFETSISSAGVVSLTSWHVPTGTPPTAYHDMSIDVLVIACRTALATLPPPGITPNPPYGLSGAPFGGSGGYTVNGPS